MAKTARKPKLKRYGLIILIAGGALLYLVLEVLFQTFYIPSGSMSPTILIGDYILTIRRNFEKHPPQRGEIVVFVTAGLDNQPMSRIFRVIGLPGETISIRRKKVSINGSELNEPWAVHRDDVVYDTRPIYPRRIRMRDNLSPLTIPDDAVFVMGDNRDESHDSRFIGTVKTAKLTGEALFVYWSGQRYGRIGTRLR